MSKIKNLMIDKMNQIDIKDVENLEIDGVDSRDYPDFCDAFFCAGEINGRELTDDELDYLTDTYPELLGEMAYDSLI